MGYFQFPVLANYLLSEVRVLFVHLILHITLCTFVDVYRKT